MAAQADPSAPVAKPNPLLVWANWTLELLKLPAISDTLKTFAIAFAAVITAQWAAKPADKAPIPAADLPSIVTHDELTKAHADLAARIANHHAEFRKAMEEVKALVQAPPPAKATKK